MTRRCFLAGPAAYLQGRERVSREVFLRSPAKGVAVMAQTYYTATSGGAMVSIEHRFSRSDTVDVAFYRYSKDYGRWWSSPTERTTSEKRAAGMLRRHPRTAIVDPATGQFIEFWIEGILPTDNPLEGMRQWNIYYRLNGAVHQVIHDGAAFHARHPLPGVYTGENMVMLGDVGSIPLALKNGLILLPAIITPLDAEGKLYNPTGGYTYTDAIVLHGRWDRDRLKWRSSEPVKGDPARCTRGMDEPTLALLTGGRLMMVMRGSNDPSLPGYKWVSYSSDGGFQWSAPQPWTYQNGQPFFSPSASSQLLHHSNGKLYWLGHISATNPRGNRPRYPVYVGEVDQKSGLLIRDTLILVDDRRPGEDEILMLYSPYAREDRQTGQIAVHLSRLFAFQDAWIGDAMLYRVSPTWPPANKPSSASSPPRRIISVLNRRLGVPSSEMLAPDAVWDERHADGSEFDPISSVPVHQWLWHNCKCLSRGNECSETGGRFVFNLKVHTQTLFPALILLLATHARAGVIFSNLGPWRQPCKSGYWHRLHSVHFNFQLCRNRFYAGRPEL